MARATRKYLLDRFQSLLEREFNAYCHRHQLDATTNTLVTFMVDHELVTERGLMQFVVQQELDELYPDKAATKTQAVEMVAHRFNISQRTVWNILKKKSELKSD